MHGNAAAVVVHVLQSRNAGQAPIVYHDGHDVNAVLNCRRQFLPGHHEAAVAADRYNLAPRKCDFSAQRSRKRVPHRNE